jgi:tetratricopeptide (TPR) repeat protein
MMPDSERSLAPPVDKPHRLAVFENVGDKRNLLARLTLAIREDEGTIKIDGPSEDSARRIADIIRRLNLENANRPTAESVRDGIRTSIWGGLIEALENEGFGTEEIPAGDHEIKIEIDLQAGRSIGTQNVLHDFAIPDEPLARRVLDSIAGALKRIPDEIAQDVETAVADGHPDQIVSVIKQAAERGAFSILPTERLFMALFSVDIGLFEGPDKQLLRDVRLGTAQALRRYQAAGAEAEALLQETPERFDDQQKGALGMVVAMATQKKGNKEAALHMWRRLLNPPTALDSANRAWAWRNISLALERENPEARHAAKCSADAFLEAGDVKEAGASLMRLVDCLLYQEPASAIKALDEIVTLTNQDGLQNRGLRAAAYHARANRLTQLGGHSEAFANAKEAVTLWRGLIGTEEQLISSLHLAALEAKTIGESAEAKEFEDEAERLTDEIDKPHFKLARRVISLFQSFDEHEAAELLRDAEHNGNREVIAAIRVAQATRNPLLSDTERLSLLEDTLSYLDKAGAREAEKAPARLALAGELLRLGDADRADEWYRKILAANPFDGAALQTFVNSLWHREKWSEAIPPLEQQIQLRGPLPGFLYAYGRSLYEAGRFSDAVTALTESIKLATAGSDVELAARKIREEALEKGGKVLQPPLIKPALTAVTREESEQALDEFARHISANRRMAFWRKGKTRERAWIEKPERQAKNLLDSFFKGKFGERVELFDELASGAGRLDLYLQFYGGLRLILELKMCGHGYSGPYAASGEEQIRHYMENRHSHLGYLIVFDARSNNFRAPLITGGGQFIVFEKFIDVRPSVKAGRASASPEALIK